MRDQRVASLAERLFVESTRGLCNSLPKDAEREAEVEIEVVARKAISAAEKFYEVLQGSGKAPTKVPTEAYPGHGSGCPCFVCSR